MDEDELDLVRTLYTRIAIVMEDTSSVALFLGGPKSVLDPRKTEEVRKGARKIAALAEAVDALSE